MLICKNLEVNTCTCLHRSLRIGEQIVRANGRSNFKFWLSSSAANGRRRYSQNFKFIGGIVMIELVLRFSSMMPVWSRSFSSPRNLPCQIGKCARLLFVLKNGHINLILKFHCTNRITWREENLLFRDWEKSIGDLCGLRSTMCYWDLVLASDIRTLVFAGYSRIVVALFLSIVNEPLTKHDWVDGTKVTRQKVGLLFKGWFMVEYVFDGQWLLVFGLKKKWLLSKGWFVVECVRWWVVSCVRIELSVVTDLSCWTQCPDLFFSYSFRIWSCRLILA